MTPPEDGIALLGATSLIARDFILANAKDKARPLHLYARRPEAVAQFLAHHGITGNECSGLSEFGRQKYQAIINFIGVGDPAAAAAMGSSIFEITRTADLMVLDYLERHPQTRYIFASSGAVYGAHFPEPATETTAAIVPVNALGSQNYYQIAKLYAEGLHRANHNRDIIDIRIFNYFSREQDLGARFLICDMINAVRNGTVFKTDENDLMRDFLHPADFDRLINACVAAPAGSNCAIDAYSRAPISKMRMIALMEKEFGMKTEITARAQTINATGQKSQYISVNRTASKFGYEPEYSSENGLLTETKAILGR